MVDDDSLCMAQLAQDLSTIHEAFCLYDEGTGQIDVLQVAAMLRWMGHRLQSLPLRRFYIQEPCKNPHYLQDVAFTSPYLGLPTFQTVQIDLQLLEFMVSRWLRLQHRT